MKIDPHEWAAITKDRYVTLALGTDSSRGCKALNKPLAKAGKIVRHLPLRAGIKGHLII